MLWLQGDGQTAEGGNGEAAATEGTGLQNLPGLQQAGPGCPQGKTGEHKKVQNFQ